MIFTKIKNSMACEYVKQIIKQVCTKIFLMATALAAKHSLRNPELLKFILNLSVCASEINTDAKLQRKWTPKKLRINHYRHNDCVNVSFPKNIFLNLDFSRCHSNKKAYISCIGFISQAMKTHPSLTKTEFPTAVS